MSSLWLGRDHSVDLDLDQHRGVDRFAAQQRIGGTYVGENGAVGPGDRVRVIDIAYKNAGTNDVCERRAGLRQGRLDFAQDVDRLRGSIARMLCVVPTLLVAVVPETNTMSPSRTAREKLARRSPGVLLETNCRDIGPPQASV